MAVQIIFITHSTSEDNEAGIASGWFDTPLSSTGEAQARRVGERYASTHLDAVYTSDLMRARRTAELAFADRAPSIPIVIDHRLREVDYGDLTRHPRAEIDRQRVGRVDTPHPGGESYQQAVARHVEMLDEIRAQHDGATVLIVGTYASWMAMEFACCSRPLVEVAAEQREWQPGWRYHYD